MNNDNKKFNACKYCTNNTSSDKCNNCDGDINFQNPEQYLQIKNIIKNRYIIDKIISANSEGATYLSYDKQSDKKFFIREYMPVDITNRVFNSSSIIPLAKKEAQYKALMVDFTDLYKTLANIATGVIPIKDIFVENNTVYIVKEYIELVSLKDYISKFASNSLSWYKCKPIFLKINSILSKIHRNGLIHRGISPYTIFFDKSENIYISEFCISCVRTAKSELTAELFEGYSAPEQYQTDGWQGTWTDVYSVAATLYTVLIGQKLPPFEQRTDDEKLLLEKNKLMIPKEIATTIIKAITLNHRDRTQTIDQFNIELIGDDIPSSNTAIYSTSNLKDLQIKNNAKGYNFMYTKKNIKLLIISFLFLISILIIIFGVYFYKNLINSEKVNKIDEEYVEKNPWLFEKTSNGENDKDIKNQPLGQSNANNQLYLKDLLTLPNFVGEQIDTVKGNSIYTSKLKFIIEYEFSESNANEIIHQNPLPGISLKDTKSLNVMLKVSKGPEYVEVPDIIGKPIADAKDLLQKLQIKYEIVEVYDKNYKKDIINQMNKNPGEKIIKNKDILVLRIKSSQLLDDNATSSVSHSNEAELPTYITEE